MIYQKSLWINKITKIMTLSQDQFLNHYIKKLTPEIDTTVITLKISGNKLKMNPTFVSKLSNSNIIAVIKHELLHESLK